MNMSELYAAASGGEAPISTLQNVVGFSWGVKITNNKISSSDCVTVLVRKKRKHIAKREHIPSTIQVGERQWPTDVVKLGRLRLEASAQHIRCGNQRGTAGIYASRDSQYYAVSCSHVITGDDRILTQDDDVEYFASSGWRRLGPAIDSHEDGGEGTTSEWGAIDAGMARIDDPELRGYVMSLSSGEVFDHQWDVDVLKALILNKPVHAIRGNGTRIDAYVFAILTNDTGRDLPKHDLLIRHHEGEGLTRLGDSGIVWRLSDGTPLGMHFGGYNRNSQGVSTISAAFFVNRLAFRYNASLIDPDAR